MTTALRPDPLQSSVATCRSRLRQVLEALDGQSVVSLEELMQLVERSHCAEGHDLHFATLMSGLVVADDEGMCRLGRAGIDWLDEEGRPSPNWRASTAVGAAPLRAWQVEALDAWCQHGRRGVVEAVTGTGKSRVGIEATREALSEDYSVVIAVPTRDLVEQWEAALLANAVPGVGVVGDGSPARFGRHRVLVGTVQSLYREPPVREDGKVLLVADECHRYGAGQWRRLLHTSYRRRLGLTATFERNDDGIKDLLNYFGGAPIYRIGFDRAIADGVVAHYDVKLLGVQLSARERGEYDEAHKTVIDCRLRLLAAGFADEPFGLFLQQVTEAAEDRFGEEDPTIVEVARRYLKAFTDRIEVMSSAAAKMEAVRGLASRVRESAGTLLFTRTVAAAEEIAAVLVEEGVQAEPIHSNLTRTQRRERLDALKAGRLKAVSAPTVLDEGVDVPATDLAVVLGGSKSRRQMIQRMGRVLRLKDDGRSATFIVVYARNTVEDLTMNDGREGCLDLIINSADGVEHLTSSSLAQQRGPVAAPSWPDNPLRRRLQDELGRLGPLTSLVLSDRAVSQHQSLHSTTEELARRDLELLLADLEQDHDRSHPLPDRQAVVARSGYAVTVDLTLGTVASYDSNGQQRTYSDYVSSGRAADLVEQLPLECPDGDSPLEIDTPEELFDYVDLTTVHYPEETFQRLVPLVDDGRINDWDADRAIRYLLTSDISQADVLHHLRDGAFGIVGKDVLWVVRGDGLSVVAHELQDLDRLIAEEEVHSEPLPDEDTDDVVRAEPVPSGHEATRGQGVREGSVVDQIERLIELKERGYLTDEEFAAAKAKVLS